MKKAMKSKAKARTKTKAEVGPRRKPTREVDLTEAIAQGIEAGVTRLAVKLMPLAMDLARMQQPPMDRVHMDYDEALKSGHPLPPALVQVLVPERVISTQSYVRALKVDGLRGYAIRNIQTIWPESMDEAIVQDLEKRIRVTLTARFAPPLGVRVVMECPLAALAPDIDLSPQIIIDNADDELVLTLLGVRENGVVPKLAVYLEYVPREERVYDAPDAIDPDAYSTPVADAAGAEPAPKDQ